MTLRSATCRQSDGAPTGRGACAGVPELSAGLRWAAEGRGVHGEVERRRQERAAQRAAGLPWAAAPDTYDSAEAVRGELESYRRRSGGADVPAGTAVAAAALPDVLAGGQFAVTGAAFFRPSRLIDPAPVIPPPSADPSDASVEVLGDSRLGLRYPEDFR